MISLLVPAGLLITAGLITLSSISQHLFYLQLIWVALGSLLVGIFLFIDWRTILNYRWLISGFYIFVLGLLVFVYLGGPVIRGTRSWLVLGPLNFQPVELLKVSLIFLYAQYFSRRHLGIARWKNILTSFFYFALPSILVALQPDLGSALVLFGIWFGFLLVSGLPPKRILAALAIFLVIGLFMWQSVLKDYQKERIIGVFYPEKNVLSINYSLLQSKIAIGSAGFFGKGYGQGTETQLGFLTEPATDFIFSALTEEWGWLAGILVITAFLALIYRILKIGVIARRNFEKFICLGTAIVFGFQFFLNLGSAIGFTPVIGVTFPLLSYGGSSLLTSFLLLAIVNAIAKRS